MTLFDPDPLPTNGDRPRCNLCPRPVHRRRDGTYDRYCSAQGCRNRERICQNQTCGKSFVVNADGAGTKYCSTPCKIAGYHPERRARTICAWCDKPSESTYRGGGLWPYICAECTDPIKHLVHRLKSHHVPHARARLLLNDPRCEICGRDIVAKNRSSDGKIRALLVVDHDHACCPGQWSCGQCVRGLICTHCNVAAGSIMDDPRVARYLAEYLERWFFLNGEGRTPAVSVSLPPVSSGS